MNSIGLRRPQDQARAAAPVASAALLVLLLGGCQTGADWHRSVDREIDKSLDEAVRVNEGNGKTVPPEVSEALIPPLSMTLPEGQRVPVEPRFNLTVNNAPARQVFMGLVEGTRYSMVVRPDVDGQITLNLKDVTVPEAVAAIRETYGYAYRRDGERFFILGRGVQTQLYSVNYLNFTRKALSRTRVASGELGTQTNNNTSGTQTIGGRNQVESGGVNLDTESEANFWRELQDTLTRLIGDKDGRKVVVNPQAGLVIVTALPDELRIVERFLNATHDAVSRQVILEAKVVSVTLTDEYKQGINWSKLFTISGDPVIASQIGGQGLFDAGTSDVLGAPFVLDPSAGLFSSAGATQTSAFGGVFTLTAQSDKFNLLLELLRGQGDVHVLSSPRVSTVNNQKAVIKVGDERFFITDIQSTGTVTGVTTTFFPSITFTPFFSGVALDVTPQIDDGENIILHIHPAVTEVQDEVRTFTLRDEEFTVPLARNNIQTTDNIVRARSGQIIVIGGLMREAITNRNARVPLIGDVPALGELFKQKAIRRIKSELVILLRPTIVKLDQQWAEEAKQSRERVREIRQEGARGRGAKQEKP